MMASRTHFLSWTMILGLAAAVGGAQAALAADPVALAYVANAGNNYVQVLDLESGRTLRKIYAGATPWRLVVSPDGRQLWAQHWYSATTAVIDLEDHEVVRVVPVRGPGVFAPGGERFLSFNWPLSTLHELDARTFEELSQKVTTMKAVYDLAVTPDGKTLYMAQFDAMAQGRRKVYSYILGYPWDNGKSEGPVPVTLRTGQSPIEVRVLENHPFLFTANHETNGLSLLNVRRAGRAVPTCPAPRTVLVSPGETRMIVACWRGRGARTSEVVRYVTDFTQRPWPDIRQEHTSTVGGALVAGALSPAGDRAYLVDRTGGRLLEVDSETLEVLRAFPTGDEPVDVVVVELPARARKRLEDGESRARRIAKQAIAKLREHSAPFTDLSWTETSYWHEPKPRAEGADETPGDEEEPHEHEMIEKTRRHELSLKGPGWLRSESEEGQVRLAQAGTTLAVDTIGRFSVTPRQELIATLYSTPNMSVEEAVRQLAGDVPGSPFLRSGLALDIAAEVERPESDVYVIGAPGEGSRVAQLWVDAKTGRPLNLVEQVPTFFSGRQHGGGGFSGIVETRFYDFTELGDGRRMPTRLERVVDGQRVLYVVLEEFEFDRRLPDERFSLARLGGATFSADLIRPVAAEPAPPGPSRAVPILAHDYLDHLRESHPPYNSNPPTSGAHVREIADWGVHQVPVPLALQVHNLELGGVVVQYNCPRGCPGLVADLERIVRSRDHTLLAPYPMMEARITLTAWGRIATFDELDEEQVVRFIEAYAGQDRQDRH